MKLKNKVFINQNFIDAVKKIDNCESMSAIDSYRFYVFLKKLIEYEQIFEKTKLRILNKYGVYNEKQQGFVFHTNESAELFEREYQNLLEEEFSLNTHKIKFREEFNLAPAQMRAAEDILDFSDLEKEEINS